MTTGETPSPPDDFDARLRGLRKELKEEDADQRGEPKAAADSAGMGVGLRVAADLVAGVVVGAGIGYLLDRWLGTKPFLLMLMLVLGFVAGIMNVYRTAQNYEKQNKG